MRGDRVLVPAAEEVGELQYPIAHTLCRRRRHDLAAHLREVARMAERFCAPFGACALGYWIGLWHDLGKADPEVQEYLKAMEDGRRHPRVPHARWGAALAYAVLCHTTQHPPWEEVALPILGHHAGLHDPGNAATNLHALLGRAQVDLARRGAIELGVPGSSFPRLEGTAREMRLRMAFSALVDADYLSTEAHFDPHYRRTRDRWPDVRDLWTKLERAQTRMMRRVKRRRTMVNTVRREVYEACVRAAEGPRGVYRLTVPTGGGKTRSGLAFALRHATLRGLRRVIVAIPYTSIIDQTAAAYRGVLGARAVLEHHSQVPAPVNEEESPSALRLRLATENWDAPVVVTTTVQLFESLFASHPGRARKLHNLAGSVIVLDEVQALPPGVLEPTLDALRYLVDHCGITLVLCTATQPALQATPYLSALQGLEVREIVPQYAEHFCLLQRVDYKVRSSVVTWKDVAEEIREVPQVLTVVNTRRDALCLLDLLEGTEGLCHLSTLLCSADRRAVLAEVRQRLAGGHRVCLVSTQVVECGVDLDFPFVYRAMGPLDRIVQAAGRCNREGGPIRGQVVVFEPEGGGSAGGHYRSGTQATRHLLQHHPPACLHNPAFHEEYFRTLYSRVDLDQYQIQPLRRELNYPEVARLYRLIDDDTAPVVVPHDDAPGRLAAWIESPSRRAWQRLQPYLVSLPCKQIGRLLSDGLVEDVAGGLYRWLGAYSRLRGVEATVDDPSDLERSN